eukprot:CAMPEP_0176480952 /NCGR_PEP_ID=MMETSP0200_2-20121128/2555_1 /TAXON_ID=947934 /ORGANISM="Chaetoceros sp., Strain GSL56" /LENGTH=809 /DNA_ID=CAMNT_0017877113 /DNA_START=76 /DNA_END=2502 /DNA_ORIENTATION=-
MDSSIYPSETVEILQGGPDEDDDSLSTLSGCSSSHTDQHSSSSPSSGTRVVAAATRGSGGEQLTGTLGHKKFQFSPLRNKTKLEPYLNGKLPIQVSAALKLCNDENRRKGTEKIPGAISICSSTTLLDDNPILDASRNSESDHADRGVAKQKDDEQEINELSDYFQIGATGNERNTFFDSNKKNNNDHHLIKEQDNQSFDIQQTISFLEKSGGVVDNSMSDSRTSSHSRFSCRSPIKGNTARQKRLQRLRRLKLTEDKSFKTDTSSNLDSSEIKKNHVSNIQELTNKSENMNESEAFNKSSSNHSTVNEVLEEDDLVKPSLLVEKELYATPKSNKSLLDTHADVPHGTPGPATSASLEGLYNNISNSSRHSNSGRIHRSFWSVIEPDSHVVNRCVTNNNNGPIRNSSISSSSPSHGTDNPKGAPGMPPSVDSMVNVLNSTSRRSTHSSNSRSTNISGKSEQTKSSAMKSSPDHSVASTKSDDSSNNKTGKDSPQRSQISIKTLDDLYHGIVKQLQCNTSTKCPGGGCKSSDIIDEPPTLKRLMLASDVCSNSTGCGFSGNSGSGSVMSYASSSVFSNLADETSTGQGSNSPKGTVRSKKSENSRMVEHSTQEKFQLFTPSGNDDTEDDSETYIAQISIGITRKSKPNFNDVIAELQKDLENAGIAKESVSIRLFSPSDTVGKGSPCSVSSATADNTVLTKSTVSEECSIFQDFNSRNSRIASTCTIEKMTVFAKDQKVTKEENPKPMRQLRRNILSTPSRKIVKKIRKATDQMLRRKQQRRHSFKLGDEHHLLSSDDIWDGQGSEEEPW